MKIYTKTGDQGETGLLGGDRVHKDSVRIEAIGAFDELNAYLGICIVNLSDEKLKAQVTRTQNDIFDIGSELACPPGGKFDLSSVSSKEIELLESEIDAMQTELPELKAFILPGGTAAAAHLHFARTLCRRAERRLLTLHRINPLRNELIIYVNRLSDWMFCCARFANYQVGAPEQKWSKGI